MIDPFLLQKNIIENSGLFKKDSQEDAHEFMTYLIDQIAEDQNRIEKTKSLEFIRKQTTLVQSGNKTNLDAIEQEKLSLK